MAEPVPLLLRAAMLAVLLGGVAACARPTGDFGRAQPGTLHDEIMPAIGKTRAELAGEPVSRFNLTDQETEMHDRVWRFLVAAHAHDWFHDTAVELQRTRLSGVLDTTFEADRYYRWLRQTDYRSSRVRYQTVADHVKSDSDTMPATFRAICAVIEIDRQRAVASREFGGLEAADVWARKAENDRHIDWFVRAVRYRYDSYGYALDHLLVETPHEEAVRVDALLSQLAIYVERAERRDFCSGRGSAAHAGDGGRIPSRVLLQPPSEGEYRK